MDASTDRYCRPEARLPAGCGDALCEGAEDESNCAIDCATAPPACQATEPTEQSCFDGLDNDCDTLFDCADATDCDGAVGPTTSCGLGVCAATGNLSCSAGSEINSCTPGAPTEPGAELSCNDGLDNDCDGLTDANDPDCQTGVQCSTLGDRTSCRDAGCRWKKNVCIDP